MYNVFDDSDEESWFEEFYNEKEKWLLAHRKQDYSSKNINISVNKGKANLIPDSNCFN